MQLGRHVWIGPSRALRAQEKELLFYPKSKGVSHGKVSHSRAIQLNRHYKTILTTLWFGGRIGWMLGDQSVAIDKGNGGLGGGSGVGWGPAN